MTSEKQKQHGYLLPDPVTGYDTICLTLQVPNHDLYLLAVKGALSELSKWWNWEKSYEPGDTRAAEAALLWRELLRDYLVIGDCGMGVIDVRQNPTNKCKLEKKFSDTGDWIEFADTSLCPPTLRVRGNGTLEYWNGTLWIPVATAPGEEPAGYDPRTESNPPNPPIPPAYTGNCPCIKSLAWRRVRGWIEYSISEIKWRVVANGTLIAISGVVSALLISLFSGGTLGIAAAGIASFAGLAAALTGSDFDNLLAALPDLDIDTTLNQQAPCEFTCEMRLTDSGFASLKLLMQNQLVGLSQGIRDFFIGLIDLMGRDGMIWAANNQIINDLPSGYDCACEETWRFDYNAQSGWTGFVSIPRGHNPGAILDNGVWVSRYGDVNNPYDIQVRSPFYNCTAPLIQMWRIEVDVIIAGSPRQRTIQVNAANGPLQPWSSGTWLRMVNASGIIQVQTNIQSTEPIQMTAMRIYGSGPEPIIT